jgi:hypothetical protein
VYRLVASTISKQQRDEAGLSLAIAAWRIPPWLLSERARPFRAGLSHAYLLILQGLGQYSYLILLFLLEPK